MRARQYMSDVIGGEGAVLAQHAKPDDFRKKFEEAHIKNEESVQKFLQKIQADKEGYVYKNAKYEGGMYKHQDLELSFPIAFQYFPVE